MSEHLFSLSLGRESFERHWRSTGSLDRRLRHNGHRDVKACTRYLESDIPKGLLCQWKGSTRHKLKVTYRILF